ncbi:cytochrome P450 [Mycolicibacterium pyrenivorans]|uniref:cytochrome P450 n=1 Tax=Mycolicibacterium pyrenivorans TaxID=187102 RepID=UPI0021F353A2|nr:cytochrome P450 [Mycolicibacterium pyrenivorans]MCV7149974.1 cytochrome P450 [Mycolicibacterium pyrenivorans]
MVEAAARDVYYDPYDFDIDSDPYPYWKRLRDEAPLYHNEKFGFYALSRYDDVQRELHNWETFRSGKGTILDFLVNNIEVPPGILLFEDPPIHDLHRKMLSRVFTPRRMNAIEPLARRFCVEALEPLVGESGFDLMTVLAKQMPMRVIGALLGIPESSQVTIRDGADDFLAISEEGFGEFKDDPFANMFQLFADYIDWRADNPSDDLMTDLLHTDVEETDGTIRRLTRDEALAYSVMIAGAGNETTTRLIGFAGQLLADHDDQRRELAATPTLIGGAVEEVLRFEAPSPVQARYVARDAEFYGQRVPEGSAMLLINGSANRDERHYEDPDRFDIHRKGSHLSFGVGLHFCLGSSLARMEARVALEEVLKRWPDWSVDYDAAEKAHTQSVRGWAKLPLVLG